jgi:hypothetical protein
LPEQGLMALIEQNPEFLNWNSARLPQMMPKLNDPTPLFHWLRPQPGARAYASPGE